MNDVVEIFRGKGVQPWFVRLKAANGRTLAISEGYVSKWGAKRAARRMYPGAKLVEVEK